MNHFREKTSSDTNYVTIKDGNGCSSSVGMRGGQQWLTLRQSGCYSKSTIQHEFIHAMGFDHVQSRPDRDQYVDIVWDNIYDSLYFNYKRQDNALTYNVPYDGRSFMHYRAQTNFNIEYMEPSIISKVNTKVFPVSVASP